MGVPLICIDILFTLVQPAGTTTVVQNPFCTTSKKDAEPCFCTAPMSICTLVCES